MGLETHPASIMIDEQSVIFTMTYARNMRAFGHGNPLIRRSRAVMGWTHRTNRVSTPERLAGCS